MCYHGIEFSPEKIAEFCRRHRIRRMTLFGSILRGDFTPESDVDVLEELDPEAHIGLLTFVGIQEELGDMIGHRVDLNTPECLSRHFREEVLQEAKDQYVAA
jgi:uncharacterized protein